MTSSNSAKFTLFEAVPDAIVVVDDAGHIVFSNAQAQRAFGRSEAALCGAELLSLVAERYRKSHNDQFIRTLSVDAVNGDGARFTAHGLRSDGAEFPLQIGLRAVRDGTEQLTFVVAALREQSSRSITPFATNAQLELARTRAQLDALPHSTVLLDGSGRILAVNSAWRRFGEENGACPDTVFGEGLDYLTICEAAHDDPVASAVRDGVRQVLANARETFEIVYPAHSQTRLSWFRLVARRVEDGTEGAVLTHVDVTDYVSARARLNIQATLAAAVNARLPMITACRVLAVKVCEELEWDYAGIWTLDVKSWSLRCATTWSRPGLALDAFEQANREALLGPGVGLPGRTWTSAKVQWVTELDSDDADASGGSSGKVMPPAALREGFRTAMAFPLKCGDDVLAVVELFSRRRRPPEAALMEQLEAAGDQLALWELTERAKECARLAEVDAEEARTRLESVLECAPAFVVAIDRAGAVQFVNRSPSGTRREELIGAPWQRLVARQFRARVEAALETVLRAGLPQSYETAARDSTGNMRWYTNYMGPMRAGDHISGAVVIAQDVTSAKLAQAELADAQRLAAVGTLAAGVAHEINTPVQFVSDSIHFLRDATNDVFRLLETLLSVRAAAQAGGPAPELVGLAVQAGEAIEEADLGYLSEHVPKAFERSIEGLERVATIVRSMKEFAHPAQKEMAPVDLNRAIAATLTVARNEYKYVADLQTSFGELPAVTCHINEINQVVLNILVNAAHAIADVVKGTSERGLIRVTTQRDGEDVLISISDTGGGIPPAIRHRIFDPFFTTKEVGRGTGQGLAIARTAIRDNHRGELSLETELGKGTTFLIRLPIAGSSAEVSQQR